MLREQFSDHRVEVGGQGARDAGALAVRRDPKRVRDQQLVVTHPEPYPGASAPRHYGARVIMIAAWIGVAVLGCLAAFQLFLVGGAPLGRFAWGGQHTVLPTGLRIGSVVSIVIYAAVALLMLQSAGVVEVLPEGMVDVAMWVLAAYFALGVALNLASRSRPERMVMTPVALVLLGCCLVLALD